MCNMHIDSIPASERLVFESIENLLDQLDPLQGWVLSVVYLIYNHFLHL